MVGKLGELERAVMDVLWSRPEPCLVREVAEALAARELAYTTVLTVLDRLAKKGAVRRRRDGRAWRYEPSCSREEFVAQLMLDALDLTGDRHAALARFVMLVGTSEVAVLDEALEKLRRQEQGVGRTS